MTSKPVVDLGRPDRPVRVAAIDDHPIVLRGLAPVLQESGSKVELVGVAPTVAAWLGSSRHDVDVVLLDLLITSEPDIGANVARIRAAGPQVVLFTEEHRPALVRAALDAGALGLVLKDDDLEELVEAILAARAGQHYVSSDLAAAIVDGAGALVRLSPREVQVLTHLARGLPHRSIARLMGVSEATIPPYLKRVAAKYAATGVINRSPHELAAAALAEGHVDLRRGGMSPQPVSPPARSPQPGTKLWFRHGDPRYPFAWESSGQPAARWHGEGEGPACYLADTPDGAWAEFLRHEEIDDVEDLADVRRRIWAVEVDERDADTAVRPNLDLSTLRGGPDTYEACREAARRLRWGGATVLRTTSAALVVGGAGGEHLRSGMTEGGPRDGEVLVVYGSVARCRVWAVVDVGSPTARTLSLVEPL